jgi:hypothetical protein
VSLPDRRQGHATKVQYRINVGVLTFWVISVAPVIQKLNYEKAPNSFFYRRDVIRPGRQRTAS